MTTDIVIKLHNTKTRRKEVFTPIDPDNVRMYVCGPTVYDRAHLGNARPVVVFDVLYRLLRQTYGAEHVTYARNFTDVDDKINKRAADSGRDIGVITDETIQWFLEDMGALGALEPDHMPRATQYIAQMVTMTEALIAKGHAYAAEGHVLFAVDSWKQGYGKLSGRSVDDMIAGARVEVAPYKRNPMDFVLWKPSTADQPGWDSPWGRGRPGWHIECSAMSYELLGDSFDIHGGGNDLMFPHHENEIAQSCCANGDDSFAKVWLHNEMLQVEGKKMSKSLGNFFTVRDLLEQGVPGEVIRFVFLSTHYRKPMDWTDKKAKEAEATLRKWTRLTHGIELDQELICDEVVEALGQDLNTPLALSILKRLAKEKRVRELKGSARLIGLTFYVDPDDEDTLTYGDASDRFVDPFYDPNSIAVRLGESLRRTSLNLSSAVRQLYQTIQDEYSEEAATVHGDTSCKLKVFEQAKREGIANITVAYQTARDAKDFVQADLLRDQAVELGFQLVSEDGVAKWLKT
ncbi:cysteine--tRNA ligase [Parasedimentitalea psychrophila]|uniref:Cysteine--tRNA ligase n=1 Tax=Parasedimentitalea psychrophila TaxID=2997337 RepID=A0A9Y2L122_9RHOB|nr:cysteine--tRNA ligase [Parasedimentitalea psychrophila]WIY24904.1 cysteine--tRNA ligase [Parasedimentitalea psychrophila]